MKRRTLLIVALVSLIVLVAAGLAVAAGQAGEVGKARKDGKAAGVKAQARPDGDVGNPFVHMNQGEEKETRAERCLQEEQGECAGECDRERIRQRLRDESGGENGEGSQFRNGSGGLSSEGQAETAGECSGDCLRERDCLQAQDRLQERSRDGSCGNCPGESGE